MRVGLCVVLVWLLAPALAMGAVDVGKLAPEFSVPDDAGNVVTLAKLRGKFVVLEWHEKGCPYVTKHYRSGHMQQLQREWMKRGVTWLLLSSSEEGAHSYLTPEESRAYRAEIEAAPSMLLDTDGKVGQL